MGDTAKVLLIGGGLLLAFMMLRKQTASIAMAAQAQTTQLQPSATQAATQSATASIIQSAGGAISDFINGFGG